MQNKTKGLIAGVAGIALLTGGSTFALWSAKADLAGGTITSGDLNVTTSAGTWYDISADRADNPQAITNVANWRMVPGDTAQYTQPFDVTLVGDNMAATVTLALPNGQTLPTGAVSVTYSVEGVDDRGAGTWKTLGSTTLGQPLNIKLFSADNPIPSTGGVVVGAGSDIRVVATVTFDEATSGRTGVSTPTTLPSLDVIITQSRDLGTLPTP